jgi:pyrophosphatase PpaX
MVAAYPGVVDMVKALRHAGLRTGLVTSKNRPGALRGLRHIGLEEEMDLVIGADEVENPKPHPEPIELALERLGEAADRAIYVGDSIHDMRAGRAAGVRIGAVLWGPFDRDHLACTEPDYWLEQPGDLVSVVRAVNGDR